ncbi:MAG: AAA domain-containing protein [Candidatus Thiodiazotropha sp.]
MSLAEKIIAKLKDAPGQLARDMAAEFGVDKKEVNSLLYGRLKGKVWQDKSYRWFPRGDSRQQAAYDQPGYANTPLARLSRYYLACIGQDEGGMSVFAANQFDDLDYAELEELPLTNREGLFNGDPAQKLLGKLRKDRSRLAMYLGYPCALKHMQSRRSSWSGYFVEPLFLYPVEFDGQPGAKPRIDLTFPVINQSVLKRFTNADRDALMDELVQLEDELGLNGAIEPPELDELAHRLASVRPEWPWLEPCDPDELARSPALSQVDAKGIYNRAVLVVGERSPFTQGLESELKALASLDVSQYQATALGHWVSGDIPQTKQEVKDSLVEVLPLNSEQREAIQSALGDNLTIITGPPGTGKSQVVTNLLINAAWQDKRVLFASKNNKAVDVVEVRVNNLGPRPILLRVGSSQYQTKLAEYLLGLLSATSGDDDQLAFEESQDIQTRLEDKLKRLDAELERIVVLRNLVDKLERAVEDTRMILPTDSFSSLKNSGLDELQSNLSNFRVVLKAATRSENTFTARLFWRLTKQKRYRGLESSGEVLTTVTRFLAVSHPKGPVTEESVPHWHKFYEEAMARTEMAEQVREYFQALQQLQAARSMESIAHEQADVIDQLARNAEGLWRNWLRLQPSKLSREDRGLLSQYSAILKMVIDTGLDQKLSRDVYKQYAGLFPKVAHLLPCWAVTSLSARGKLPFQPGFFDLVVFDEASQCDIASALPLLYRAKRAAVIGDPKQLAHISGLQRGQDQQLLGKFDLVGGYANWAYSYNSLFHIASGMASGSDIISLRDHHRSHAQIIEFSNRFFYEGRLRVATRYGALKFPASMGSGARWVHIDGQVNRPASGGAVNPPEAKSVVQTLRHLLVDQRYAGSVGVVSPFRAQVNQIRDFVGQDEELEGYLVNADFLVDTVHKFQGDERDVMIFSPVLAKGISPGAIGFLKNNGNLFNVAITRARAMLIVVGDKNVASNSEIDYLREFAKYVQHLEQQDFEERVNELIDLGPQYPKVSSPERVSDWERILYVALYKEGIKTLPQYQVEKYALDLALFDGNRMLDIEVDGERYHRNWTGELCRRDQIRNHRLFELGWDVLRFWVYEIRDDLEGCVLRVAKWLDHKTLS